MPDNIDNESASLSSVLAGAFKNLLKEVHTTLPGEIVSFDPITQSASVQITIRRIFVTKEIDGTETEKPDAIPLLTNVPVIFGRGGGWCITHPIKEGDECIVHFSERSFDDWRKNGGVQTPTTWRMHSYSDAFCQVGLSSEPNVISNFDNENFQIRNEEGDVSITLMPNKEIVIKTSNKTTVEAPTVQIDASSQIDINTPTANFSNNVNIGGDLDVSGESSATDHISGGISGKDHKHIGSPTAALGPVSNTGVPI